MKLIASGQQQLDVMFKECSACGVEKLAEDFYRDSHQATGLRSYCKSCDNQKRGFRRRISPPSGYSTRFHRQRVWFKTRKREVAFFKLCEEMQASPEDLLDALVDFAIGTPDITGKFMEMFKKGKLFRDTFHDNYPWLPVVMRRELRGKLESWAKGHNLTVGSAIELMIGAFIELESLGEDGEDMLGWARHFAGQQGFVGPER